MSSRGHRTPERRRGAPAGGSDGVGAWDTGGGTGADIDVAGLDEATRSQFEFLRERRARIQQLLRADPAAGVVPRTAAGPGVALPGAQHSGAAGARAPAGDHSGLSTPPRRVRVKHRSPAAAHPHPHGRARAPAPAPVVQRSPRRDPYSGWSVRGSGGSDASRSRPGSSSHASQGAASRMSNASPTARDDDDSFVSRSSGGSGGGGNSRGHERDSGAWHRVGATASNRGGAVSPVLTPKPTLFVDDDRDKPDEPIRVVPGDPFQALGSRGHRDSMGSDSGVAAARPGTAPASTHGAGARGGGGSGGGGGASSGMDVEVRTRVAGPRDTAPGTRPPPDAKDGSAGAASPASALDSLLSQEVGGGVGGGSGGAAAPRPQVDEQAQLQGIMALLDQADSKSGQLIAEARPPPVPPSLRSRGAGSGSGSGSGGGDGGDSGAGGGQGGGRGGGRGQGRVQLAANVFSGVRAKLQAMSLELQSKDRTIATLQGQNRQLKAGLEDTKVRAAASIKERVEKAKSAGAATAARHLAFIDRLLADKAALAKRVEELEREASDAEAVWKGRMKTLQERHVVDVRRAKDQWAAAEKSRRVAWEAEKEKAIKAMTIKGLEPELQRMLDKNKAEIARVKELAASEVRRQREVMEAKYHEQRLRQQEAVDTAVAAALNVERETALATRKQMVEQYEEQLSAMRQRLAGEMDAEHRRIGESHREQTRRHAEELARVRAMADRRVDDVQKRLDQEREDTARRIASTVQAERERAQIEREAWQNRQLTQLRKEAKEAERETRANLVKQRDEQVKMVIKRLDEEMEAALGKLRGEHETETKATAARHKAEVEQLRADLSAAQRKADAASQGIADVNAERDAELHRLNAKVQALNGKLASTDAACAALRADLAEARASARREKEEVEAQGQRFRDASARQVSELQRLLSEARAAASQAEADAAAQIAKVKQSKAEELEKVASRVREALAKRDKVIQELRGSLNEARAVQADTEALLEKQRRELLGASGTA